MNPPFRLFPPSHSSPTAIERPRLSCELRLIDPQLGRKPCMPDRSYGDLALERSDIESDFLLLFRKDTRLIPNHNLPLFECSHDVHFLPLGNRHLAAFRPSINVP